MPPNAASPVGILEMTRPINLDDEFELGQVEISGTKALERLQHLGFHMQGHHPVCPPWPNLVTLVLEGLAEDLIDQLLVRAGLFALSSCRVTVAAGQ